MLKIFSFFPIVLFVFPAQADLVSEFGLSLSRASVNQLLSSQISGDLALESEIIELGSEGVLADLKHSRAELSIDSNLQFSLQNGNTIGVEAELRTIILNLKDFNFTDVTVVNRGGINATVTTKITCSNLKIELNDWTAQVQTALDFKEGGFVLDAQGGNLVAEGDNVDIDLSNCQSPLGVDIVFKNLILEWVASQEGRDLLFDAVLDFGQTFVDEGFEDFKETLNLNIFEKGIDVLFNEISFARDKVKILGLLTTQSNEGDYSLSLNQDDFDQATTESDLLLPDDFFSRFLPDFMKEANVVAELTRSDVPEVDVLFNKRILQFFVWRDLLNFKKSSDFAAEINIKTEDLELISTGETFKYSLQGQHNIDMDFLNSAGARFPYMNFAGSVNTDLELSVTDQGLSLRLQNPKLRAKANFQEEMSEWRTSKTKAKPWMKVILPRINSALDQTPMDFTWTDLGLDEFIDGASMYKAENSSVFALSLKQ